MDQQSYSRFRSGIFLTACLINLFWSPGIQQTLVNVTLIGLVVANHWAMKKETENQ